MSDSNDGIETRLEQALGDSPTDSGEPIEKAINAPSTLSKLAAVESVEGETLTAYATVEMDDSDGDVIRVKGMDIDTRNTDASPMKVLVSHMKVLPDGSPPLLGTVTRIFTTTKAMPEGGRVPAVKFQLKFLADADMVPQVLAWKRLYQKGLLDSFSVGLRLKKATLHKNADGDVTGLDVLESELFEISAVTTPANPMATVTKLASLLDKEAALACLVAKEASQDAADFTPEQVKDILKTIGVPATERDAHDQLLAKLDALAGVVVEIQKDIKTNHELFESRLDELVSKTATVDPPREAESAGPSPRPDLAALLRAHLDQLKKQK